MSNEVDITGPAGAKPEHCVTTAGITATAKGLFKDRIKVSVRNLERLGEYQYTYDYDEFGPARFDEMGKAILAQLNQLRRTGRHQAECVMP